MVRITLFNMRLNDLAERLHVVICSVQSTLHISTLAAQLLVTSSCPLLAGVGGEEPQPSHRTCGDQVSSTTQVQHQPGHRTCGDQVSTPELQQGRSAVERSSLHLCSSLSIQILVYSINGLDPQPDGACLGNIKCLILIS